MIRKTFAFIRRICKENNKNPRHGIRTLYWLRRIDPTADEALQLAALLHDIDRVFRKEGAKPYGYNPSATERGYKRHQAKSARFARDFLEKEQAAKKLIERVAYLIEHHEGGGDKDSDALKDADSLASLESPTFLFKVMAKKAGKSWVKNKIKWMYSRITSIDAKNIAECFYRKANEKLKSIR